MRTLMKFVFAALLAAAAMRTDAQAAEKKFYAGIGFAFGSYDLSANGYSLASTYKSSISYYGELGVRLKPSLALGFEADYYTKSSNGASISVWYYNAAVAYYPSANPFWIKILAGYSNTSVNQGVGSEGGFDMGLGFGYDWHVKKGKSFAIVPFIQYISQLSGGSFANDPLDTKYSSRLFQLGAAVAFNH
jgi:hypothetical protein